MKKLWMLAVVVVLAAVLAGCGSSLEVAPIDTDVPSADAVYMAAPVGGGGGGGTPVLLPPDCPVPCCGSSVTFACGASIAIAPAGTNVSVYSSILVALKTVPTSSIRVLVSPAVNCTWVWSSTTQLNCAPRGATFVSPGLAYGTTYTVTAQRWSVSASGVGSWTNLMTSRFTTEAKPVVIFR